MSNMVIQLDTVSPLSIRVDHAPGGSETIRYISGTTLLGALANAHRTLYPKQTSQFEQFFLSEKISFPNLYPASFMSKEIQNAGHPVYPLPKTAQSCKRFSGFQYMAKEEIEKGVEQRHGVRDTLLDWAVFSLLSQQEGRIAALSVFKPLKSCHFYDTKTGRECNETLDRFTGYLSKDSKGNLAKADINVRLQTHTGINREQGTVQEGILYNRVVIGENSRFNGVVILPDNATLVDDFSQFIKEANEDRLIRIGTGRTRGLGKVSLEMDADLNRAYSFADFKNKLQRFNDVLHQRAEVAGAKVVPSFFVAMTLHAPLLLRDPQLRYYGSVNGETLAHIAGLRTSPFSRDCHYQAASFRRVMGWNEQWGTPRGQEFAIDTGSVFLYTCSTQPDDDQLDFLFKLEQRGCGRRWSEGFGRVSFSDPFHAEVNVL